MIAKDSHLAPLHNLLSIPLYSAVTDVDRTLVSIINDRRSILTQTFRSNPHNPPLIDAYHGEMGFPLHPAAAEAASKTMTAIAACEHPLAEPDGTLYSKSQPKILRRLAASRLFDRMKTAPPADGLSPLNVHPDDVVVVPYSALAMFETVMASLATETPGATVLCPAGFYKEFHQHIQKFGLRLAQFPTDLYDNCTIDPEILRTAIRSLRAENTVVAAVGLTIPGNPLIAEYNIAQLSAIGRVLVEEDVRAVVDSSFDKIVPPYTPLAALVLDLHDKKHSLYDRVLTITGVSKSFMAFGPLKFGAACVGDAVWRAGVRAQATLTFQRESTALAAAVMEATPASYVDDANIDLARKLRRVVSAIEKGNLARGRTTVQIVGKNLYGPFLTVSLADNLLLKAGVERGHELSEMVIAECGVDNVAGDRVGFANPCIRLNVHCPRVTARKDYSLTAHIIRRLFAMADRVAAGELTYASCVAAHPPKVREILGLRRVAVVGVGGARWLCGLHWPAEIIVEQWGEVKMRAQLQRVAGEGGLLKKEFATCRGDLYKTVHAVVMTEEEAKTRLEEWIGGCKVGSLVIVERLAVLDGLWEKSLGAREKRNVRFMSFKQMEIALKRYGFSMD